jgi:hypothetical protein
VRSQLHSTTGLVQNGCESHVTDALSDEEQVHSRSDNPNTHAQYHRQSLRHPKERHILKNWKEYYEDDPQN